MFAVFLVCVTQEALSTRDTSLGSSGFLRKFLLMVAHLFQDLRYVFLHSKTVRAIRSDSVRSVAIASVASTWNG